MAEQFDAKEILGRDFFGYAIFKSMHDKYTNRSAGYSDWDFGDMFGIKAIERDVPQPVTVEFRVNGVDVPIRPFFEHLWAAYKADVLKTARQLVSTKVWKRFEYASELLRTFEKAVERELHENEMPTAYDPEEWLDHDPRSTHHLDR